MFKALGAFFSFLKKFRLPLLVFFISTLGFLILLFPLNDVGDLVSAQVSKATANQTYLQFDNLELSVMPFGLKMNQVYVETPAISALRIQELTVRPSVSALIRKQPYGYAEANGVLRGNVSLSVGSGTPSDKGIDRAQIALKAEKVSLKEVRNLLNLPFFLQGDLNVETQGLTDLTFQEQPDMELNLVLNQFELPPTNINTQFGPLTLPELKLKQVELKGRLSNGTFIIEKGEVGKQGDELQATLKGSIQMSLRRNGMNQIIPVLGAYNLDVDLRTQGGFQQKAGLFLSFLQSHQKAPGQYKFKVASSAFGLPPQISTLR